jgi:hypothetical protein
VDQFAAQRAAVQPLRQLVGETRQHALAHARRRVLRLLADVESLLLGDLEELLEQRSDLPRPCACTPSRRQASTL